MTRLNYQSGEWVLPGQVIVVLADLEHLRIETTDLSELDIMRVAVGQAAKVTVKALGQTVSGKVSAIAPLAEKLGDDVVYRTTVELDGKLAGLRAGMSVEVEIGGN